jgi:drug/metabolite transporter (DMT)-like permease
MLGILFSLMPLAGFGAGDYVASKMSKSLHPGATNLFFAVTNSILIGSFSIFFGLPVITLNVLIGFAIVNLIFSGGFIAMLYAFKNGATGIVAPIANAYAVITLLVSVLFLDSEINTLKAISVLVVVCGIILLSQDKTTSTEKTDKTKLRKTVFFSVIAMFLFGLGFVGFDIVATQKWYQNAILSEIVAIPVGLFIYLLWVKKNRVNLLKEVFRVRIAYVGSIVSAVAFVGLFLAIENSSNIVIPATIAAASPLVTALLARYFDLEKLHIHQRIGAVVVVGGIILLSLQ